MALINVKTVAKPECGQYEDKDVYAKSSDIRVFNLYDQSWADLQAEGLAHLVGSKTEFERRQVARQVTP